MFPYDEPSPRTPSNRSGLPRFHGRELSVGWKFSFTPDETVRQKQGLTYDIRTHHSGDLLTKGNWVLSASFAPALLDKGSESTRQVVDEWYKDGVSEEAVRAACSTLIGSYLVRLSTTSSVATQVHASCSAGFPLTT